MNNSSTLTHKDILQYGSHFIPTINGLSHQQILLKAPAVFKDKKQPGLSPQYQVYTSLDILQQLESYGWIPIEARQTGRKSKNADYRCHLLRFIHPLHDCGTHEYLSIVFINSHDATSAYRLYSGIFRFVCMNGILLGDIADGIRLVHRWNPQSVIQKISNDLILSSHTLSQIVQTMKQRTLTQIECDQLVSKAVDIYIEYSPTLQYQFAKESAMNIQLITDNIKQTLSTSKRVDDDAQTLWNLYQRIHEHVMKGFSIQCTITQKGLSPDSYYIRLKRITSIQRERAFCTDFYDYIKYQFLK